MVPGKLYRSSHPTPGQLARAVRRVGLRSVVNLRGEKPNASNDLSVLAASRLGLEHRFMAFESRGAPHRERVLRFHDMYRAMAFPALLHCKSGADRAGLAAGLAVLFEGGTARAALAQMSWRFGHVSASNTGVLDAFFHAYAAVEHRIGFLAWVSDEYDETGLRSRARGAARLLNDRVLRRE